MGNLDIFQKTFNDSRAIASMCSKMWENGNPTLEKFSPYHPMRRKALEHSICVHVMQMLDSSHMCCVDQGLSPSDQTHKR